MYIVLFYENVMSLRLFERSVVSCHILECNLYLQVLGHVLYAAVMLSKFYKLISLEKKKKIIQVFSKQHGLSSQDSLVVGSVSWEFYGVAGTSPASRSGDVSRHVDI